MLSAFVAFGPVAVGALRGFSSPKESSPELLDSYATSSFHGFRKLRFPSAMPYLILALAQPQSPARGENMTASVAAASIGKVFNARTKKQVDALGRRDADGRARGVRVADRTIGMPQHRAAS